MRLTFPILITLLGMSCAPARYDYVPSSTTGARLTALAGKTYPLPDDGPRGSVRIALRGVGLQQLQPPSQGEEGWVPSKWRGLHVALDVVNASDEVWTIEPGEQRVELPSAEPRVIVPVTKGPIAIAPHTAHSVDLQFVLPEGLQHPRQLASLNVVWVVRAGAHVVTRRTTFERSVEEPPATPIR